MSDIEQIYALFVEANPVVDVDSLPETYEEARPALRSVPMPEGDVDDIIERQSLPGSRPPGTRKRRAALVAAAVAVVVVGAATMFLRTSSDEAAPPATGPSTPSTQAIVPVTGLGKAEAFIERLDAGDVDGASELLADPIGSIWFPLFGQMTSTEDVTNYLDFYDAVGTTTELSECTSELVGPSTFVACQANHQSEILAALGIDIPAFQIQFQVWQDGIRVIELGPEDNRAITAAFNRSRFFEFRATMLIPRGLVQASGDPIWSRANGELMAELVTEFLESNP